MKKGYYCYEVLSTANIKNQTYDELKKTNKP